MTHNSLTWANVCVVVGHASVVLGCIIALTGSDYARASWMVLLGLYLLRGDR